MGEVGTNDLTGESKPGKGPAATLTLAIMNRMLRKGNSTVTSSTLYINEQAAVEVERLLCCVSEWAN